MATGLTRVRQQIHNLTIGNEEMGVAADNDAADVSLEIIALMMMLSLFSVVGSVGNGLVIFVFQRIREKTTAQVFIITLAVIDFFTCMLIIPFTMFMEYNKYDVNFDFLCKLYHFLITSKIPLSAFIMVAIAFDRYFCICHPLRRIITLKRVRVIIVCLTLLASLFGVITSMFYGVYQVMERIDTERIDEIMGTNFTKTIKKTDAILKLDRRNRIYNELRTKMMQALRERNLTSEGSGNNSLPLITEIVHIGICNPSRVIFDETLFKVYQRAYTAVYPLCLIFVMVLYLMIYRFICSRRKKKLQQKLIMCAYVNGDGTYENTHFTNGETGAGGLRVPPSPVGGNTSTTSIVNLMTVKKEQEEEVVGLLPPSSMEPFLSPTKSLLDGRNPFLGNSEAQDVTNPVITNSDSIPVQNTAATNPQPSADARLSADFRDDTSQTRSTSVEQTRKPKSEDTKSGGASKKGSISGEKSGTIQNGRRHSHLPEQQKYQWHKNRDSMKRYKGKSRRRRPSHPAYDVDRLREENRSANVKTALMLFTVTLVFIVAFVPAWIMAHRLIPANLVVFYLYFSYNVVNPFIYAFMNHIFKDYMRKMFSCPNENGGPI